MSARGPETITASVPCHRAVDLHDVARAQRFENALRHHGAGGRQIDEAAHPFAFDDTARAGRDVEHHVRRRQARHHGFGGVGDFGGRARRDCAQCGEISDRFLPRVVDDDLMSGLEQPARHVRTHIAEADEADVHGFLLATFRHPEGAAKRPSKDTAEVPGPSPFEARCARASG
jgi:hypothetical protein